MTRRYTRKAPLAVLSDGITPETRPGAVARVPFGGSLRAALLSKLLARLHPHPVIGGTPADIFQLL